MAERINRAGQTHSMELIFFPLIILIIVGLITNAFSSSAIQTVPVLPTPFCTGNIEPGECYPTNVNGCDSSVSNCNFTAKTTFSFLNPNSPFTLLLEGNIIGFFSNVFNGGESQNAIYSGYTTCIPTFGRTFFNATGSNIHNFMCQGISSVNSTNFKPTVDVPMNATSNGGNNSIWYSTGCEFFTSNQSESRCIVNSGSNGFASWNGTLAQNSFQGFYISNGSSIGKSATCNFYSFNPACQVVMPWLFTNGVTTFTCPSTLHVNGLNINATHYYCLLPIINPQTPTSQGSSSLPNVFSVMGFIFGALLFFLGFGFSLTSAIVGFSINEQGTRFAQAIGIGILLWSFIFGEFGIWLTALPFNLGIIGFTTLTIPFFLGLYWRIFAWE